MRVNCLLKHTWSCNCSCWTGAMAVSDSGPAMDQFHPIIFLSLEDQENEHTEMNRYGEKSI